MVVLLGMSVESASLILAEKIPDSKLLNMFHVAAVAGLCLNVAVQFPESLSGTSLMLGGLLQIECQP